MSGRAKNLFEYAYRLEQIKVDLSQLNQRAAGRSLEPIIILLREQAEIELLKYEQRYGEGV